MAEDDYEALPPSSTVLTHMMAGAAAGVLEHTIIYPVDTLKTRMQCLVPDPRANYRNVVDALYRIAVHEGLRNTFRGINAVIYGAGPAHAMYFACYEKMKTLLSRTGQSNHLAHGTAGIGATLLHDAVMNPADVVKQRMQMFNSPYKSCWDCLVRTYRAEGVTAFYRSYTTQLSMNIPYQSMHFIVYEFCQDKLNPDRKYSPVSHMMSGALAGGGAAAITTPLDVCKTLLNTQEKCATAKMGKVDGFAQAIRTVYKFRGFSGYFQGLGARVLYVMPGTAISWSVYEFFKWWITAQNSGARCDALTPGPVHVHAAAAPTEEV